MRYSDETLQQDASDELAFDPRVEAADIGVSVHDGAVTLNGHVTSYATRYAAEQAVRRLRGVKALANEIEVHLPDELRTDDADIATRVAHVLTSNVSIPPGTVTAKVDHGVVTLRGKVNWNYQREIIHRGVRHLRGVVDVFSDIVIVPLVSPKNVRETISRALHRNATLETDRIQIQAEGSRVTLTGFVKAPYERTMVEQAAWAVPGVTHVVDQLRIA